LATAGVLVFAWGLEVSRGDWMALIGVMALVWLAEAFNTAVEHTCDAISTQPNEFIKRAKDVAAGAVLIAAITAVGIGALVFLPYLLGIIRPSA
jgi:diacylglycerol kinase (ATP)